MVITSASAPTEPPLAAGNRPVLAALKVLKDSGIFSDSHQFSIAIDPATRQAVIRITDRATQELIEQFPSEYILQVARNLTARIAKQSPSASDKTL